MKSCCGWPRAGCAGWEGQAEVGVEDDPLSSWFIAGFGDLAAWKGLAGCCSNGFRTAETEYEYRECLKSGCAKTKLVWNPNFFVFRLLTPYVSDTWIVYILRHYTSVRNPNQKFWFQTKMCLIMKTELFVRISDYVWKPNSYWVSEIHTSLDFRHLLNTN